MGYAQIVYSNTTEFGIRYKYNFVTKQAKSKQSVCDIPFQKKIEIFMPLEMLTYACSTSNSVVKNGFFFRKPFYEVEMLAI